MIVFEVKLDQILAQKERIKNFTQIPRHLDIERDLAIVVEKDVLASDILDVIKESSKLITNIQIFDIYTGEKIKDTEKSVAVKIFFNSNNALTDTDINKALEKIINNLGEKLNARLRD